MELARIMATHRPIATIKFAAVAGEEQGLLGATYMAQTLANASANVQGMWTNDIVGSPIGDDGKNQVIQPVVIFLLIPCDIFRTFNSGKLESG